jgi:hypothetical protein
MDISLGNLFNLYVFSTGRRMYAMGLTRQAALALGNAIIVSHIDEALAHDRITRMLDLRWAGRELLNRGNGKLKELDGLTDNTVTALRDGALLQTRGMHPRDRIHTTVDAFLTDLMPGGVQSVTGLPYVEQISAVDTILARLQGPLAPMVQELGLNRQVDRLAALAVAYRAALDESNLGGNGIAFEEVRKARELGQQYLMQLLALIVGGYYQETDEHRAARQALLAPILQQNEAIRAFLRARRAVRDVDPESGVEEPAVDEPAAAEPAAPTA